MTTEELEEQETIEVEEYPAPLPEKKKMGRPRKAILTTRPIAEREEDAANIIFACDKYPNMRVLIPVWQKDEVLKEQPYADFLGGRLNMKRLREYRELTEEQAQQAIAILKKTKYVYAEHGIPGPKVCGMCGKSFPTTKKMLEHGFWVHREELNLAQPARPE